MKGKHWRMTRGGVGFSGLITTNNRKGQGQGDGWGGHAVRWRVMLRHKQRGRIAYGQYLSDQCLFTFWNVQTTATWRCTCTDWHSWLYCLKHCPCRTISLITKCMMSLPHSLHWNVFQTARPGSRKSSFCRAGRWVDRGRRAATRGRTDGRCSAGRGWFPRLPGRFLKTKRKLIGSLFRVE